jgi:hypothetical protein
LRGIAGQNFWPMEPTKDDWIWADTVLRTVLLIAAHNWAAAVAVRVLREGRR